MFGWCSNPCLLQRSFLKILKSFSPFGLSQRPTTSRSCSIGCMDKGLFHHAPLQHFFRAMACTAGNLNTFIFSDEQHIILNYLIYIYIYLIHIYAGFYHKRVPFKATLHNYSVFLKLNSVFGHCLGRRKGL